MNYIFSGMVQKRLMPAEQWGAMRPSLLLQGEEVSSPSAYQLDINSKENIFHSL